jgi:hypothetical protein
LLRVNERGKDGRENERDEKAEKQKQNGRQWKGEEDEV